MSITSDNAPFGGISFSGGAVNGGFNFDLPLASIAMFNSQALDFSATSQANRFGFLSNVFASSQASVNESQTRAFNLFERSNAVIERLAPPAQSSGGGGGGFCFITSAVCKSLGLADDCEQLTLLRKFRDEYMMQTLLGDELVKTYYEIAPPIVEKIDASPYADIVYWAMLKYYIEPAITFIKLGDDQRAFLAYCELVKYAEAFKG